MSFLINGLILLGVLLLFPQGAIGLVYKLAALVRGPLRDGTAAGFQAAADRGFTPGAAPAATGPTLVIENLSKSYGGVVAVSNVSLASSAARCTR